MKDKKTKRELWIDCAKYCAIIAVAIDHTNGVLYNSSYIATASYFSVELFILLSGFGAYRSWINHPHTVAYQFKKIQTLFKQYTLATFVIHCYSYRIFDLKLFIYEVFTFSISGPFYFFVFFFFRQIILLVDHSIINLYVLILKC